MRAFLRGFVYAARGIRVAVMEERNLRFHLCAAVYVYLFSSFYAFTRLEYALLTVLVGGVIALEIVNSAFERIMDEPAHAKHKSAGIVKDMGAGAVLVFCIAAAVCGVFLFWNTKIFYAIFTYFINRPWMIALLAASLAASGWFVFGFGRKDKERKND